MLRRAARRPRKIKSAHPKGGLAINSEMVTPRPGGSHEKAFAANRTKPVVSLRGEACLRDTLSQETWSFTSRQIRSDDSSRKNLLTGSNELRTLNKPIRRIAIVGTGVIWRRLSRAISRPRIRCHRDRRGSNVEKLVSRVRKSPCSRLISKRATSQESLQHSCSHQSNNNRISFAGIEPRRSDIDEARSPVSTPGKRWLLLSSCAGWNLIELVRKRTLANRDSRGNESLKTNSPPIRSCSATLTRASRRSRQQCAIVLRMVMH